MRKLAWLLIILAFPIGIGGWIWSVRENDRIYDTYIKQATQRYDTATLRAALAALKRGQRLMTPGEFDESVPVITGAIIAGIGILILAIRRPKKRRVPCPDCAELIKGEARKCRYCGYDFTAPKQQPRSGGEGPTFGDRLGLGH